MSRTGAAGLVSGYSGMVRTLITLLILLASPLGLPAQSSRATATVRGVVLDSSDAAVPAAGILVRNQDTGAERRSESDAAGAFSVSGLPPGVYTVEIEVPGFATIAVKPFVLAVGQTATQSTSCSRPIWSSASRCGRSPRESM